MPFYVLGMQAKHAEIKKQHLNSQDQGHCWALSARYLWIQKNFFQLYTANFTNFNCKVPKERKVSFFTIGSHFACKIVCEKSDYQFNCKDRHIISGLAKITLDILSVNMLTSMEYIFPSFDGLLVFSWIADQKGSKDWFTAILVWLQVAVVLYEKKGTLSTKRYKGKMYFFLAAATPCGKKGDKPSLLAIHRQLSPLVVIRHRRDKVLSRKN